MLLCWYVISGNFNVKSYQYMTFCLLRSFNHNITSSTFFDKLYCAIKKSSSSYFLTVLCLVATIFIINVINYVYHIIFYDSYLILGHKFDPGVIARTLHVLMAINDLSDNFPPFIILSHMLDTGSYV